MKILIIRFSSIGDIVLTSPVARALKKQLGAEVHYYTKPAFASILQNNPNIDKVFTLPAGKFPFRKELISEEYDYVIDLHNNLRSRLIKLYLRRKSFTFNKLNFKKFLLVNFKVNQMPTRHIVDRYMDTLSSLNVKNDQYGLDYFIPQKDKVELNSLPQEFRNGYAAVVIGATYFTKRLPLHKLSELIQSISRPVVLLGGKEDSKVANDLLKLLPNKVLYNASGKYNLNQSASLIENSEIVYTHDTGLMHIASALKKEVVSIWGNTVPEFGMYPYKTKYSIIENKNLSCRPCSKIGFKKCPKGHFKCMEELRF